ncbi:MAG TPA: cobalamin-binding protein [Anaerolineaceae bacterium]|nr:MAG: methyltransferase [Chloroflexi bacterium GWB2_54_36]HAL17259.1 cobalamin-binding protein [Anaerolineaceae bacterium]
MIIDDIKQAVIEGDATEVKKLVALALEQQVPAEEILKNGMISGMGEVGRLFEEGEYFVPEMLIAARAMQGGLGILRPVLVEQDVKSAGKVVLGTVKGDLHDIGKNLVGMMLEGAGFQIVDLGTDVSPEKFIEAIREHQPDIVGMSALLTTTMPNMDKTIKAFNEAGVRQSVKVMVGGAPVTKKYAGEIGADGFAPDANQATAEAKKLLVG